MVGNEIIHRRNLLLFTLMGVFYFIQIVINLYLEGVTSIFPPVYLFMVMAFILLWMIRRKVNSKATMYVMVVSAYVYFYFLLRDSPYLVNYLFMWLGLPLSAIYQNYRVVVLALGASIILTYYSFFYLHEDIFPNVVLEDFVFLVLFGVFIAAFLLTFIHITLRLWREVNDKNENLQELAYHDPLTGAANRLLLKKEFDHLKNRNVNSMALLFVDMDGFKRVNDTYGHDVGDQLLGLVASRIKSELKDDELLCRLGGDEFVILLSNVDHVTIRHLVERILQTLKNPLLINSQAIQVSASIGGSYTNETIVADLEDMIREADRAMYLEKGK